MTNPDDFVTITTYFDVLLWLWREKKIALEIFIGLVKDNLWIACACGHDFNDTFTDPEEAIITATDYLVDNDLIK